MQPCGPRQFFSNLVRLVLEEHVTNGVSASARGEYHSIGESVPRGYCFHVGDVRKTCLKLTTPPPSRSLPMQSALFYYKFLHPKRSPQTNSQCYRVPNKYEGKKRQHVQAVGSRMNAEQAFQEHRAEEQKDHGEPEEQPNCRFPVIVALDMYYKRTASVGNRNSTV